MASWLIIESLDPFDCKDVEGTLELSSQLAGKGEKVALFLVQNGVFLARPNAASDRLAAPVRAGVEVLADEFSLRERGIDRARLAPSVKAAPIDRVVDCLEEGRKALFL